MIEIDVLTFHERDQDSWFADAGDLTIFRCDEVFVREAFGPIKDQAFPERRNFLAAAAQVFVRDAEEGWLHGTGRDFRELKKKCGEAENRDDSNEEFLHVFANGRVRIRLEPFPRGLFEVLHLRFQVGFGRTIPDSAQSFAVGRLEA